MIEVYSWPTPNGHQVHVMLEDCVLPDRAIPVGVDYSESRCRFTRSLSPPAAASLGARATC